MTHLYPLALASADLRVSRKKGKKAGQDPPALGRSNPLPHLVIFLQGSNERPMPSLPPSQFLVYLEQQNESFFGPLVCYRFSFVCSEYCVGKLLLYCAPVINGPL